jgi:hypothetical protein
MPSCRTVLIWTLAAVCALMVLSAQIMTPLLAFGAMAVVALFSLVPAVGGGGRGDPKSTGAGRWLGPQGSELVTAFLLMCAAVNVIWALRYAMGVREIFDVFVPNATLLDSLTKCGADGSIFDSVGPRCQSVIASFLGHPLGVYFHITGAIGALALGY